MPAKRTINDDEGEPRRGGLALWGRIRNAKSALRYLSNTNYLLPACTPHLAWLAHSQVVALGDSHYLVVLLESLISNFDNCIIVR